MTVVLDSWAIMRLVEGGPGAKRVQALLRSDRPIMSWINVGEVFYVLRRAHGDGDARSTVRDLQAVVNAELPSAGRVLEAAAIKAQFAMAYADAFAAATAIAHDADLWTGDPELLIPHAPWRSTDLRGGRPRR